MIFLSWSGEWKDLEFKDYNYGAHGQPISIGYVQPLLEVLLFFIVAPFLYTALLIKQITQNFYLVDLCQVRDAIQNIFLEMG